MTWVLERVEGFEHGQHSTVGGGLATALVNATASTTNPRTGSYSGRLQPQSDAAGYWEWTLSATTYRTVCFKGHVKLPGSLPGSDLRIAYFYSGSGHREYLVLQSDGKLKLQAWTGETDLSTATFSGGDYVGVELMCFINASTGVRTLRWKVNGTDEGSFTSTDTSTSAHTRFYIGTDSTTGPFTSFNWDDCVIWVSTSEETTYPADSSHNLRVKMHNPNADGTHTMGSATWDDHLGNTIDGSTTTSWQLIDNFPSTDTGDYVEKLTGSGALSAENLRHEYQSTSDVSESTSTPKGAHCYLALAEEASQAENTQVDVTVNAVTTEIFNGDIGSTAVAYKSKAIPNNSWTTSHIDAMYSRFGGTDPAPDIRLYVACIQVAYLPATSIEYTDSATAYVDIQASGTELQAAVDSATAYVDLAPSSVEVHEHTDATTVYVNLEASGTEFVATETADASTVPLDLEASGTEYKASEYSDADTSYLDLQASGVDIWEAVDSQTVPLTLTPSGVDIATTAYTDQATIPLDLEASGIEAQEHAYLDEATAYLDLQPSSVEAYGMADFATVSLELGASGVDIAEFVDSATVPVDLQASGTEFVAFTYTDSAEAYLDLQSSGTEYAELVDSATVYNDISIESSEFRESTDTATVGLDLEASGTDVAEFVDTNTVYVLLTPSGTEYLAAAPQIVRPDGDISADGWQVAPLWSKLSDESNATYIYATAS